MLSDATPISPPTQDLVDNSWWIYVECAKDLYRVAYDGRKPDLTNFSNLNDHEVERINLSAEVTGTLRCSSLLSYGSDSFIREDPSRVLPIVKLAHPNCVARARLAYEFQMLQKMNSLMVPTPQFDPEPLTDSDGIYGYRMERLQKLDYSSLKQYRTEVKNLLQRIHSEGMTFGDLHPGNIMQNEGGKLVFIDPSCAGISGDPVPSFIRPETYEDAHFDVAADKHKFAIYFS